MWRWIGSIGLVAALGVDAAWACGGFFCQNVPVDQAAERIFWGVDAASGQTEMIVQISYDGPAEDFAWALPLPSEPTLFASVDDVMTVVGNNTFPLWNLSFETEGECRSGRDDSFATAESADVDDAAADSASSVTVVSSGRVGNFDTVVLTADSSEDLLDYLQDNDFNLPDDLSPKLDPYIVSGNYFVVLKLAKGNDAGDITPIGMTYASTTPMIPLQLTAIAATPDMRVQPYVFADSRGVPDNYLHVKINEFAIDWLGGGQNYPDVITQAANEAGGQAFATDFSGPTEPLRGILYTDTLYDLDPIRGLTDAVEVLTALQFETNVPISNGTAPIIADLLPVPAEATEAGATDVQFFSCPECWPGSTGLTLDGTALANDLETEWIPAMERGEEFLQDYATVTRLTSSISAEEMTVDPTFVLNPDMPEVARSRNATLVTDCTGSPTFDNAPRILRLADGREMVLPPDYADGIIAFEDSDDLADVQGIAAEIIEETSASGDPILVDDRGGEIASLLADLDAKFGTGCGCRSTGAGWLGLWLAPWLVVRRRRG